MTARHSAAVARYSRALAGAAGASIAQQHVVHTAGLFHDIGKFTVPDSILQTARGLSEKDWEVVRRHPAAGAKIVGQVPGYEPIARAILHHHERIDGAGYPDGLSGNDIPWISRVISVADTYDVMTARDSYNRPRPVAEAVAELRRVAGSQLDARLVSDFVELLESHGVAFRHADDAEFEAELAFERPLAMR
jgi:putative nucleotidyltransferase with HDIG domain